MITIHTIKDKKIEIIEFSNLENISYDRIWIDISNITKEESEIIEKKFQIHHLIIEDLINSMTRIKIEEFSDYLFFVFYAFENKEKIKLVELDFILNDKFLITNHKNPIDSFEQLKSNFEKLQKVFEKGNDFLFHYLIDKEVDEFHPILEDINETIENIEEEIINNPNSELMSKILSLKREINKVRKNILAQREKFSYLTKNNLPFFSRKSLPYFRDVYDHMIRASDLSEDLKETITSTYDLYMTTLSNKMNDI
ncbi:MAG: hypothetical protein KC589_08535, partial [Nanoarchaeota archaeon]|nr:hypothetical protein [Nanoarchaeota archaeon]